MDATSYEDIQEATVDERTLTGVCLKARDYSQSIYNGNRKEWDSKRPFAVEGIMCLYSISEERQCLRLVWT